MSRPRTRATPVVGVSKLSRHLMTVLLPAPFGPSNPMVPGGTFNVTSESAFCAPYVLPSPSVSIIKSRGGWLGIRVGKGEVGAWACNAGVLFVHYTRPTVEVTEIYYR